MSTGMVKWINEAKGFGLVTPDSGGKDIFAQFAPIRPGEKSRSLKPKQKVSFDIKSGPDGDLALNIKPIV